jgi:quercetin dioxygenase-like cupin family protein
MDRADFEAALQRDGYTAAAREMAAGTVNPDHTHDFDARVMVLAGAITIGRDGGAHMFGPGEWCDVPAGQVHSEQVGPSGVSYVAGRRSPA